jgi:hypothetical protein
MIGWSTFKVVCGSKPKAHLVFNLNSKFHRKRLEHMLKMLKLKFQLKIKKFLVKADNQLEANKITLETCKS